MDDMTRRTTALDYAMRFNFAAGIICPGCAITQAKVFDEFLRTGDVADLKHLDDAEEEDNVVRFPPTTDGLPN